MERTNYVAKAKNLIAQKMMSTARTTALMIVPLAAAVNAHANSVALPITNKTCSTTFDSGGGPSSASCSGGDAQLADPGSGVQGMSFYTVADAGFSLSSGGGINTITMTMTANGILGGSIPLGTVIPLGAIFSLTPNIGQTINDWQLLFSLGTSSGDGTYGSTLINCITSATCSGGDIDVSSTLIVTPTIPASSTLWETVKLTVDATGSTSLPGGVTIHVPQATSWDFGSVAATTSAVPEPASLGLMASGLALIGAWIRRRRRS